MARHSYSRSIRSEVRPVEVRPEGFLSMMQVNDILKTLNKKQRRVNRGRKVGTFADLSRLSQDEMTRLAHLIAARQNRPV